MSCLKEYPSFWFVQFHCAIAKSDYSAAAQAQQKLRDMGFEVRVNLPPPQPQAQAVREGVRRGD